MTRSTGFDHISWLLRVLSPQIVIYFTGLRYVIRVYTPTPIGWKQRHERT